MRLWALVNLGQSVRKQDGEFGGVGVDRLPEMTFLVGFS